MVFLHKTYSQHDYSREKLKIKQKKKNLQFRNKKEAVFPQPLDFELKLHSDIPCTPDNGTEIANLCSITDNVNVLACGSEGSGNVTN